MDPHIFSGKFCRVLVCASNIGDTARCTQCHHRVRCNQSKRGPRQLNGGYSAVLASYLLDEQLGHLGRVGCTLCLIGSLIIILHAPADKEIQTVDEILHYAIQPGASPLTLPWNFL